MAESSCATEFSFSLDADTCDATTEFRRRSDFKRTYLLHFASVVDDDAKCIVVTRVCVSVCLSTAAYLRYCTDPDVTWRSGKGCPLVVHYWADLQSVHALRCHGNITRTLVTSLPPSRDMTKSINQQSIIGLFEQLTNRNR